jgi:hypothetical protein
MTEDEDGNDNCYTEMCSRVGGKTGQQNVKQMKGGAGQKERRKEGRKEEKEGTGRRKEKGRKEDQPPGNGKGYIQG